MGRIAHCLVPGVPQRSSLATRDCGYDSIALPADTDLSAVLWAWVVLDSDNVVFTVLGFVSTEIASFHNLRLLSGV